MHSKLDSAQPPREEHRPARSPWPRPLRLAAIAVVILAVLIGLYAAFGFWAAPRLIRSQVVAQADQRYHRQASIGEVRVNPFTLRLEAQDFRLPDADGKPMIGFDRLAVQVSPSSIWRGLDFTEIALEGPRLRVVIRPGGRLNLMDLAPPPSGKPAPKGPPPKVRIDHLSIQRGAGEFVDLDREIPFTKAFAPIGFSLHDFSTVEDGAKFSLKAVTDRGEHLAWTGSLGVAPLTSRGRVTLTSIKAQPLAALAGDALPFGVSGGALDVLAGYDFALDRERLKLTLDIDQAKLAGVGLRARGADRDWVSLPLVTVSGVHVDAPARAVKVGGIVLNQPSVTAWLDRDGINLARLAGPAHPKAPAAVAAPAGPAWTVSLPDLRIHAGAVTFEDRTASSPVKVAATPVEFTVTGLALPITAPVQVEASTGVDGGGRVAAKGSVDLTRLATDLDLDAQGLTLQRVQPYLDKSANLNLLSGKLGAHGHLTYADGAATYAGQAAIDDLHTVDRVLKQDLVNWRRLALDGISVQTKPLAIKVKTVTARAPYAKLVIGPNYVTNIQDVLSPPGAVRPAAPSAGDAKTAPTAPRQALPVEIGLVRIQGGTLDYGDLTLTPHFAAGIQSLGGTIKGLSGRQDARATVALTGQVDRYSPVKIDGQINYFAARSYTDVKMSFQNIELTTLSPYSGKFAGYRIDKGKLNIDLHYNIDDTKLHATHHVVINQLQLGDKVDSADAVKLPVKLIVALLKDRNGVIDVPIEIDGSLDDPKFKVWPVIWHIVHNLMVKVATAPFTALGKLFGGGEELSYVDFAPGAAGLDEAGGRKVASLAQALNDHPAVNLEIPMVADPAADRPVLAEARYQAEIAAAQAQFKPPAKAWYGKAPTPVALRRAMLEQLYQKDFGARPEVPKPPEVKQGPKPDADQLAIDWLEAKIRAHVAVSDQDLQQLGRARAQAVQDALMKDGKVDPTRVFIVTAPPADAPQVRMQLTLK
ncbi:DUF748 domain-containing protein [Phenylobacterium montanum]|uniref:DUF748 domain-containing protein n=1 Tax=Phenylobacterium montanum TaxID=2823693 RepID=A0A975IVJ7_9CAUL|nr:DUF748 domain-containing protein [Caulobacter sp. S6]QUD89072.1 DUF748 domain-containing protein [Caulobacter sp. S6]